MSDWPIVVFVRCGYRARCKKAAPIDARAAYNAPSMRYRGTNKRPRNRVQILLALGFVAFAQAQPAAPPTPWQPAESARMATLERREIAHFRHSGTTEELFKRVASALGVPVEVHWRTLDKWSVQRAARTTDLHLRSTNGRALLRIALRELGMGETRMAAWFVGGTLHVSTQEEVDQASLTAEFNVSRFITTLDPEYDLPAPRAGRDPNESDDAVEFVIDTVTTFTIFESWSIFGGRGTAEIVDTTLHVQNSRTAIERVAELLAALQSPTLPFRETARIAPHYLHDDHKLSRRVALRLAETIDAPAFQQATVAELLAWFAHRIGIEPYVEWFQFEPLDIEPAQRITLPAMPGVAAFAWLECALDAISQRDSALGFSVRDGILTISTMESIGNRADSLLVADVAPLLRPFDDATRETPLRSTCRTRTALRWLTEVLPTHIHFEDWIVNGGKGTIGGFQGRLIAQNCDLAIVGMRAALAKIAAAQESAQRRELAVLRDWEDDPHRAWNARVIERLGQRAFPRITGEMPLHQALANLSAEADVAIWMDVWDRTLGAGERERLLHTRVRVAPEVLSIRQRLGALLQQAPPLDRRPVIHIRGAVIIISREFSATHRIFRAYPVGELLRAAQISASGSLLFRTDAPNRSPENSRIAEVDPNNAHVEIGERLCEWLMTSAGENRWFQHGGSSPMTLLGDTLLVTADASAHETIEAALRSVLERLR